VKRGADALKGVRYGTAVIRAVVNAPVAIVAAEILIARA